MVSSNVSNPPSIFLPLSIQRSPLKRNIMSSSFPLFLEQKSLFLLMILTQYFTICKTILTFRFLKTCFPCYDAMILHLKIFSNIYYNTVYHIHKSLWTSYIRVNSVKRNSQTCITSVIRTTVIRKKISTWIIYWSCSNFRNLKVQSFKMEKH